MMTGEGWTMCGRPEPPAAMEGSDAAAICVGGTGSFTAEIIEYAAAAGLRVAALVELVDPSRVGSIRHGLAVIGPDAPARSIVIGVGGDRRQLWSRLAAHGWTAPPAVIHPHAVISPSCTIGRGCIVGPLAVVGAATLLREHVLVGRGALIGHHVVLE